MSLLDKVLLSTCTHVYVSQYTTKSRSSTLDTTNEYFCLGTGVPRLWYPLIY